MSAWGAKPPTHRILWETHRKLLRPQCKTCADLIQTIFGCTDLRMNLSGAKFDAEDDFDVRSAVFPPKPHQINEKLMYDTKKVFLFSELLLRRQAL